MLQYRVLSGPHVRIFSTSLKVKHNMNYAWLKYCSPALPVFQGILLGAETNLRATWAVPFGAVYIYKEGFEQIKITHMNDTGEA